MKKLEDRKSSLDKYIIVIDKKRKKEALNKSSDMNYFN